MKRLIGILAVAVVFMSFILPVMAKAKTYSTQSKALKGYCASVEKTTFHSSCAEIEKNNKKAKTKMEVPQQCNSTPAAYGICLNVGFDGGSSTTIVYCSGEAGKYTCSRNKP